MSNHDNQDNRKLDFKDTFTRQLPLYTSNQNFHLISKIEEKFPEVKVVDLIFLDKHFNFHILFYSMITINKNDSVG